MNHFRLMVVIFIASSLLFTTCGDGGGSEDSTSNGNTAVTEYGFTNAANPGDNCTIILGTETINLIYTNNQINITFPFSNTEQAPADNQTATLTRKFFI